MTGLEQIQDLSWAVYVLIFALVLVRAVRRPTPAHIDMALFFGAIALLIFLSVLPRILGGAQPLPAGVGKLSGALLLSLAYLLLRLVRDFADVSAWLMRAAELSLLLSVFALLVLPTPMPALLTVLLVAYFVALMAYDSWAFVAQARRTRGVTRRRMQAAGAGSAFIAVVLVFALGNVFLPDLDWLWGELSGLAGLCSAICYFVGFTPPTWLRRAWQEPELRGFLGRAASLPRLPDTDSIVRELEGGAAEALGAARASIGLWDRGLERLRFLYSAPPGQLPEVIASSGISIANGEWSIDPTEHPITGNAFFQQQAQLVTDVEQVDPENAALYRAYKSRSALVAPITAGRERLGVLVSYAPRAPVFANSDLELIQLLADQAAVILESRALIDEATRVQAREEATRLKDDFLSSAAHDLKTPLTGLVTQAQLLLRRADRNPSAPVDRIGLDRLVAQSLRLRDLVMELLDVSRLEHGSLLGDLEDLDLREMIESLVAREQDSGSHRVQLVPGDSVVVHADAARLEQVVVNLVENAVKYSPDGGDVVIRLECDGQQASLAVQDSGIGIEPQDLALVFDRFHRGRNVDDRRFVGMGLGLYIVRGIVEKHGGRIWVESQIGRGSTFHVTLPLPSQDAQ